MSVITRVPEPNLWDVICKDYSLEKPPFKDDDDISVHTEFENYDPAKHTPVFYGQMHSKVTADLNPVNELDSAISHTACVGYTFSQRPPESPPSQAPPPPPTESCTPREYLEHYVFPILLPALEEMLREAKKEKCFERKRTKFNALDFITEYLYKRNPKHKDRSDTVLWDIPFVKDWLQDHPRPPLPLSLLWTEEEAALRIQCFWRGYVVRREPEVHELRVWQQQWQHENHGIHHQINDFWEKKMPGGDKLTPNASEEVITDDNKEISVKSPAES